jgi:hypothetical protein
MYFERQMVVAAAMHEASARLSLVARLNGSAGAAILLLQLTSTSRAMN